MNPRLGLLLFFVGDHRKVNVTIKNVTSFSAVSAILKQGDTTVTSTYITSTITSAGNVILTDDIGGLASMPAGNYRYYITGTYGSKARTWYYDIIVLPFDDSLLYDYPLEDYQPLVEEFVLYEGDNIYKSVTIPGAVFSAAAGVFKNLSADLTSTYCNGTVTPSGDNIITHNIGSASIPAGDYGYFLTGTYNNSQAKTTWFYRIKVLAKQGII